MSQEEVRINSVLARVAARRGYRMEHVTTQTPLSALLELEESVVAGKVERGQLLTELMNYIFADNPHPGHVVRRCYAIAKGLHREDLLWGMSLQELGLMLGETRAAQSWRVKKIFSGYLWTHGANGHRSRFQKSSEACASYAHVQQGNHNRRGKRPAQVLS